MANEKLSQPKPDAPKPAVRIDDAPHADRVPTAIDQPAPKPGEPSGYHPPAPPFMSEGVRNDLEQYGEAIDPNTGQRLTRADLG